VPRFAIAPLGLTTEGSTKFKLKGWKCYRKKLQWTCYFHTKNRWEFLNTGIAFLLCSRLVRTEGKHTFFGAGQTFQERYLLINIMDQYWWQSPVLILVSWFTYHREYTSVNYRGLQHRGVVFQHRQHALHAHDDGCLSTDWRVLRHWNRRVHPQLVRWHHVFWDRRQRSPKSIHDLWMPAVA